jgi:Cft2 family RNA processing exonuclease
MGVVLAMATLTAISGVGAKAPACFLVEARGVRLMLDLGYGPQPGLWPDVSRVGRIDALLLSHGHRDHAGALELLPQIGNPRVYATDIVRRMLPPGTATASLPLRGTIAICGIAVTTGRSGHAPGGVWLHLDIGSGLLYTGDTSAESIVYVYDPPPPARTVVLDASYGPYDTALTDALPEFERVFDTGPALLPVPAAGRGADIALYVARRGRGLPRLDDAVRRVLHDLSAESRECVWPHAQAELATVAREAPAIESSDGIMLAAAADAASGEAARLASRWVGDVVPAIVFTGYVPPGTPAQRLVQTGRATWRRWNVHPRLSDAADLVRHTQARVVVPAFGDARHMQAWQIAFSPASIELEGPTRL